MKRSSARRPRHLPRQRSPRRSRAHHYRNHGSDHGRVLAGIQVPPATASAFAQHLADLGYPHAEETANPAYRAFL